MELFLLSNSRKPDRPGRYAKRLDIPYLGHAGKPRTAGFEQAMARMGRTAGQTAMVGDQIFTDILGARRMGILALLVEPIQLRAIRGATCATPWSSPLRLWGKGGADERMVRPCGAARDDFPGKSSSRPPAWLASLGLDAFEYQCGKGVNVGEETARAVGTAAREHGIRLSLHAPYFINLANPDPDSRKKTTGYILAACRAADWMGAGRITFIPGR